MPRGYSQAKEGSGRDKFSEPFGYGLWHRVPSNKATTVSRKENLLRNLMHYFFTGCGTDRFCCWAKTFPQLCKKRKVNSSLGGTS